MDSLTIKQKLETAGVPQGHATAHAEIHSDIMANLVTKSDLEMSQHALKAELKAEFRADMADMRASLIYWMVGTQVGGISVICGLFAFVIGVIHS